MAKKKWDELTTRQRATALTMMSIQLSLAVSAWADLATRPADQVNGSKGKWAAVIAINYIGPILYFTKGRKSATA
ncbi:hypothetical protein GA707_12345 [Nostocoides sp. F2B08]|uniref:PLDc N-terminal domain-containing protein n=1 Tax=Nostocoides sp. F2B08 TaxID=2653936 RepID=UPI001263DFA8|nr:PLDc N-terminal domain-containing protein [Tetrasphaera sp. F2B08]KAB7744225.1 hypothetical protein GA707_12345 [Tetrasphaera sp. F2B08]